MRKVSAVGVFALLLAPGGANAAISVELNGSVTTLSGAPLTGASVTLARVGFTTSTDSTGAWRMSSSGTVSIGSRALQRMPLRPRILTIDGSRLEMRLGDFTVSGRNLTRSRGRESEKQVRLSGQALQVSAARVKDVAVIDTLLYSWNGRIISRTPITSLTLGGAQMLALDTHAIKTDIPWNDTIKYGSIRDSRDGQIYRTVRIGGLNWMAQSLNYRGKVGGDTVGVCYNNSISNCMLYGRLYGWSDVLRADGAESDSAEFRLCPSGWRVPTMAEYDTLFANAGDNPAYALRAKAGWLQDSSGSDAYGFRMLASGWEDPDIVWLNRAAALWAMPLDTAELKNGEFLFVYVTLSYRWQLDRDTGSYTLRCIEK